MNALMILNKQVCLFPMHFQFGHQLFGHFGPIYLMIRQTLHILAKGGQKDGTRMLLPATTKHSKVADLAACFL